MLPLIEIKYRGNWIQLLDYFNYIIYNCIKTSHNFLKVFLYEKLHFYIFDVLLIGA